jgi:ATP-dependent DNA helicase RecG
MEKITPEALLALIAEGENAQVELKGSGARPVMLAERLAGISNTRGGYIVMGVDDATLAPVGVTNVKYAKDNLIQAARLCQPTVVFSPPEPQVVEIDGRPLVVAYVPPANNTLYQASGVIWSRKGSQTVPMTPDEIAAVSYSRGLLSWERQPARVPATLADLNPQLVSQFLAARSSTALRHTSMDQALLGLEAATHTSDRGTVPTHAGLLMFGHEPQFLVPQAEVDCVEWRAPNEPMLAGGRGGWVDRRRLTGTLPDLIEAAVHWLAGHMDTSARIVGLQRVETPLYPLEALREAVVNAVIHRDYSLEGQSVRIFVYHDHIEVRSPGFLMPGVTLDLLYQGVQVSRPRNPLLMGLLRDWPGGRYCERLGTGIRLMIGAMQEVGLPSPVLREIANEFVVAFYQSAESLPSEEPVAVRSHTTGRPPAPPQLPGAADPRFQRLNARQIRALEFVQEQGRISNAQYRELTGIQTRTTTRELAELVELGLLVVQGGGVSRHYVLPPQTPPLPQDAGPAPHESTPDPRLQQLTERQRGILEFVHQNGFVTSEQARVLTDVRGRTAVRDLMALVALGLLVPQGASTARRYVLPAHDTNES